MIDDIVDLPAPFSPRRATNSPSYTSRSIPDSTTLVSKLFSIPRRESRGTAPPLKGFGESSWDRTGVT